MVASALLLVTLGSSGDFDAIVNGVSERSHDASCRLIQQFAGDPQLARRGVVWCARLLWADGRLDDARTLLEPIANAEDEPAMQAVSTLMDIHLSQGRYTRAAEFSRRLAASPVELWRYTGNQAELEIMRAQRLWW